MPTLLGPVVAVLLGTGIRSGQETTNPRTAEVTFGG